MANPARVIWLGMVIMGLAGCGKKEPPAGADGAVANTPEPAAAPAAGEPAAPSAPAGQPQPTPPPSAGNAGEAVAGTVDEFMTGQLRIFIQERGRLPKDFPEFAGAGMDSVPRTPAGMVWVIYKED